MNNTLRNFINWTSFHNSLLIINSATGEMCSIRWSAYIAFKMLFSQSNPRHQFIQFSDEQFNWNEIQRGNGWKQLCREPQFRWLWKQHKWHWPDDGHSARNISFHAILFLPRFNGEESGDGFWWQRVWWFYCRGSIDCVQYSRSHYLCSNQFKAEDNSVHIWRHERELEKWQFDKRCTHLISYFFLIV